METLSYLYLAMLMFMVINLFIQFIISTVQHYAYRDIYTAAITSYSVSGGVLYCTPAAP